MAGEEQYIHPIIAAMGQLQSSMLARQQMAMQLAQMQNEQGNKQNQLKIEQQRADQAEQQMSDEHEYHSTMLEQSHAMQQAQMEMMRMQAVKGIRDEIAAGVKPEALTNSGQAGNPNTPGIIGGTPDTRAVDLPQLGLHINLADLPTQDSLLGAETKRVGALTTAKEQAEQPFDFAMESLKHGDTMAQQKAQQDFTERLKNSTQEWEGIQKDLDRHSQVALANIRGGYELAGKKMEYDASPDQLNAGITGLASGSLPVNMTNPVDRKMATAFIANGGRTVPKEDAQSARQVGAVKDLMNKMDNVAQFLPDEKTLGINSAVTDAATMAQLNKLPVQTDAKEALQELAPQIMTAVRNTQGVTGSRFNPQEMTAMQSLLTGIKTKQQLKSAEQSIQDSVDNRVSNVIQAGMPTWQQNIMSKSTGITPKWILDQQNLDRQNSKGNFAQGLRPDVDKSIQTGKIMWSDPNASSYGSTVPSAGQVTQ